MAAQFKPDDLLIPYRLKACLTLHKNLTKLIFSSGVKTSAKCRPFSPPNRQWGRCKSVFAMGTDEIC